MTSSSAVPGVGRISGAASPAHSGMNALKLRFEDRDLPDDVESGCGRHTGRLCSLRSCLARWNSLRCSTSQCSPRSASEPLVRLLQQPAPPAYEVSVVPHSDGSSSWRPQATRRRGPRRLSDHSSHSRRRSAGSRGQRLPEPVLSHREHGALHRLERLASDFGRRPGTGWPDMSSTVSSGRASSMTVDASGSSRHR